MRLIEAYVENFGKISNKKFIFADGFNCIKEDNGEGKTTLSVFIKCMLYGMSDTKKPSLEENDRKHYLPWGGGTFGGTLTFSLGNKKYRIERVFGQRVSEDSVRLIDLELGRESSDIREPIGESLFGIDREGFERTVFLSERFLSPKNDNKSISAKLSDLVGSDGDIGALDEAMKILENQRKFYQKKGGGEIANLKDEIYRTEDELARLSLLETELISEERRAKEAAEKIKEMKAAEKELIARRENAVRREASEELKARYKRLVESLGSDVSARDKIIEFFGGRPPTFSEIDEASIKAAEVRRMREGAAHEGSEEYTALRSLFVGKISSYDIENADRTLREIALMKSRVSASDKADFERSFTKRVPDIEEIDEEIKREKNKKNARNVNITLLLLGILLSVLGIVLGALVSGFCFALCGIGAILFALPAVFYSRRSKQNSAGSDFFLSLSDESAPCDRLSALIAMRELVMRCGELMRPDGASMRVLYDVCERVPDIRGEDVFASVREIISKYKRYELLSLSEEYRRSEESARLDSAEKDEESVNNFLNRFKLTTESPFSEIRENLHEYNRLSAKIVEQRREITELESALRLEDVTATDSVRLDELDIRMKELEEGLSALTRESALAERQCRSITERLDARDELTVRLDTLREKLTKYEESYATVLLTKEYLTRAKDAVTVKYLAKTKESFEKYLSLIGNLGGEYDMDTSFAVAKVEGSGSHPVEAYSKGTRDLFNIAARFALIDSLYDKERPFVILDDPFISFDDTKTQRALSLLRQIAKERQIIYFTCSSSRAT